MKYIAGVFICMFCLIEIACSRIIFMENKEVYIIANYEVQKNVGGSNTKGLSTCVPELSNIIPISIQLLLPDLVFSVYQIDCGNSEKQTFQRNV
jgi:hypothetical protein